MESLLVATIGFLDDLDVMSLYDDNVCTHRLYGVLGVIPGKGLAWLGFGNILRFSINIDMCYAGLCHVCRTESLRHALSTPSQVAHTSTWDGR